MTFGRARLAAVACLALLLALTTASLSAHDIPADTTVRMFIKPEGQTLHVLARVQMASINDIDWPQLKSGYLDLPRIDPFLRDAGTMWLSDYMDVYEGGRKLAAPGVPAVRIVTDDDLSFEQTYDIAVAHMKGPKIPDDTTLFPMQGFVDVMFDYKIASPDSSFSINPRFDRLGLRVTTVLTFIRANGAIRHFEYVGLPGLIRLDPSSFDAAWRFLQLGFFHLLGTIEPLLFLFCLALPFSRRRGLGPAVGVFVAAYSLTFIAAARFAMAPGDLWFQPFISTVLALSVFYLAIEDILGARLDRRWITSLVFGLAYGFSFAAALGMMLQFAGSHPTISILTFSLGIDLAAVIVLALMVAGIALVFRFVAEERIGTIVMSAIVAHTAWHWLVSRYADLRRYPMHWPTFDLMLAASLMRWLMVGVAVAAIVWGLRVSGVHRRSHAAEDTNVRS